MKIKVKRPLNLWDTWLPLTVKLDDEKVGAVRNGDDTVLSAPGDCAEFSVAYMHDRSDKVRVEDGEILTVKWNRTSYLSLLLMVIVVLIPLVPFILGNDIVPYIWVMLAILAVVILVSSMLKSYDIEHTGRMENEERIQNEDIEGIKIRRRNSFFESSLPLIVKLDEEEKEKLKSGERSVIPMYAENAEMSVEFLYEAGNRIKVEAGDVVSIKRNWIYYLRLILLFIAVILPGLLSVLSINPGFDTAFYVTAAIVVLVIAGAMSLMKTVKLEVVDNVH